MKARPALLPESRQLKILRAVAFGVLLAILFVLYRGSPPAGAIRRGDFPAFFGAGLIVAEGYGGELYSLARQLDTQQRFCQTESEFLAFAYPPWVALIFSLFAPLGFSGAKLLWVFIMLFCAALSTRILAGAWSERAILATVLFPPLLHGSIAGQNTALSLLLISAVIHGMRHERWTLAGLCCGLLFFKPHYGVIGTVFVLSTRRDLNFILSLTLVLAAEFILSAAVSGSGFIIEYLAAVREFSEMDYQVNGYQMISLPALIAKHRELFSVLLIALGILVFRRVPSALAPLIPLVAPHTLYYDMALAIPAVASLKREEREIIWVSAFVLSIIFICTKPSLPAEFLTFLLAYVLIKFYPTFSTRELQRT